MTHDDEGAIEACVLVQELHVLEETLGYSRPLRVVRAAVVWRQGKGKVGHGFAKRWPQLAKLAELMRQLARCPASHVAAHNRSTLLA